MGDGLTRLAMGAALGGALFAGCARPPPHRSDALQRSRAFLERAARLEAELQSQNGELDLFAELGARRQEATALTCEVAQAHLREITRLDEAQRKKRRERARKLALLRAPAAATRTAARP
jgi:hypothetical protein